MWVVWRVPPSGLGSPHRFTFRATRRGAAKAARLHNRIQDWPGIYYAARITDRRPPPNIGRLIGS